MKKIAKGFLLLVAVISFTQLFAQRDDRNPKYRSNRHSSSHDRVSIIARLPYGALALTWGNRHYHYYGGYFYEPFSYGYALVEPPIGIVVPVLPPGAVYIMIGGRPYYRFQSVFYLPLGNNGYQVVGDMTEDKLKTNTDTATNEGVYEKFVLEGKTYYKKGNKYYKAEVADNGEIQYEQVGETK